MSFSVIVGAVKLKSSLGKKLTSVTKGSAERLHTATSLQNAAGTVDVAVTGTRLNTSADVVSSVLPTGAASQATLAALETLVTAGNVDLAAIEALLIAIRDTAGIKKITDALPTGSNVIGSMKLRGGVTAVDAEVSVDPGDSRPKLWVQGNVAVALPSPPDAATEVHIIGDTPLSMTGTEDSPKTTIPDGETFTLTAIVAGAEGDTTERGTAVEAYFDDNGTLRLIARIYITGFHNQIPFDLSTSRDGTPMLGDAGGTKKVFVRRRRLSGGGLEVDALMLGYTE